MRRFDRRPVLQNPTHQILFADNVVILGDAAIMRIIIHDDRPFCSADLIRPSIAVFLKRKRHLSTAIGVVDIDCLSGQVRSVLVCSGNIDTMCVAVALRLRSQIYLAVLRNIYRSGQIACCSVAVNQVDLQRIDLSLILCLN